MTKSLAVSKRMVYNSYLKVIAKDGSAGIDKQSIEMFNENLSDNLYKLWNRMTSGSYFPPPVRTVFIPKKQGGKRPLGIPTVSDRIAQGVVKDYLEPSLESIFHPSSFGYRPGKSAHDAIKQCQDNCIRHAWVIDVDIKGFFDNIEHEQLLNMLRKLTGKKHILLYCERWLKAPMQKADGTLQERTKGSPQGGVISPLLANIYLNEAFDKWISETQARIVFERYADDIVIHTRSMEQSQFILDKLKERLKQYGLELSESKTKIVYCHRTARRFKESKKVPVSFDFLGYTFKPRICQRGDGQKFWGFRPAISMKSQKRILTECKKLAFQNWVHFDIYKLSQELTPKIRGWINYYGKERLGEMQKIFSLINRRIATWIQKKFKIRTIGQAYIKLKGIIKSFPTIFEHWKYGFTG